MNAADGKGGILFVKWLEKFFDEIFFDLVITINETDIFASGELDTMVPSTGLSSIFLVDYLNTGIFLGVFFGNFIRVVGGAVVYQNNFEFLIGLIDN